MDKKQLEQFLNLQNSDFEMIIDGLDALKHKDFAGEVMGDLFEIMLSGDPAKMAPEEREKHEQRKQDKETKKLFKEDAKKQLKKKIDFLKSKLIILLEEKANKKE